MASATYISQTLTVNGGVTGILQVASTAALVVGAHVTIVALGIEPQELQIGSITNGTTFVVTDLAGAPVDLSAYVTVKNARVTQFAQRDIGAGVAGAYVQLTGDTMTGQLTAPKVKASVQGFEFPDGSIQTTAVAGGGPAIPTPVSQNGKALFSNGVVYVLRNIRAADVIPVLDITSFAAALGTREIGQALTTPSFTAAYNHAPTTATLTDSDGSLPTDVSGTPTAFASPFSFTKSANNGFVTFTLTAGDGFDTDVANTTIAWQPRVYFGLGLAGLSTESDIEALSSNPLASSRARSISLAPGPAQYIYYAFPSSYGAPTFTVGGFAGGFTLINATVSVTNAFGVNQNYQLWRSVNPNLGAVTVVVT